MRAFVTVTFPSLPCIPLLQQQSSLTGAGSDRAFPFTHDAFLARSSMRRSGMDAARWQLGLIYKPVQPRLPAFTAFTCIPPMTR